MRTLFIGIILCACCGCQMRGRGYAPEPPAPAPLPPDETSSTVVIPERRPGPPVPVARPAPPARAVPSSTGAAAEATGFTAPPVERRPSTVPSVIADPATRTPEVATRPLDDAGQRAFTERCAALGQRAPAVYREGDAVAVREVLAGIEDLRRQVPGYLAALRERGLEGEQVERHLAGLGLYRLLRLEELLRARAAELAGD